MSTRGLYGIRKNGVDKCTYNHSDSYPSWLGRKVLEFCANNTIENLEKFFNKIELVDESSKPTEEQIKKCVEAGYYSGVVSTKSVDDWYCLLRNLQGNFDEYQDLIDNDEAKTIFMTDCISFIKDSLFCEYAYIINLDDEVLEFYEGYQKEAQKGNRYGETEEDGYYPCKLVFAISLDEIIEADIDSMVEQMETGFEYPEYVEQFKKLQEEYRLDEDDARALVEDDNGDKVCGIYEDTYDIGREYLINVHGIPDFLENYVDFEKFGEDEVENTDVWYQLPSGKYAHLS